MTRFAPRLAVACTVALALSACAATEGDQRAAPPGRADLGALRLAEVEPGRRVALAREGQLQTPLRLPPEVTGAPGPVDRNRDGMRVTEARLRAAGVDISPQVRVWVEQDGQARLDYGPRPRGAADLALSPGVLVNPF